MDIGKDNCVSNILSARIASRREVFAPAPHYLPVPTQSATMLITDVRAIVAGITLDFLPPQLLRSAASRKMEFLGGRMCAEHAVSELGLGLRAIGRRATGEPCWLPGAIGSISHTANRAYAAVCDDKKAYKIGIDTEAWLDDQTLDSVRRNCCTPWEVDRYLSSGNAHLTASLIFSAKESLYKVIGAIAGRVVDFLEVEVVSIDFAKQRIRFKELADDLPDISRFCIGYFRLSGHEVHTSVIWT